MTRASVHLRGITVERPDASCILSVPALDLPPACRIAVMGPAGAGKSTLAQVIAGLAPQTQGQVISNGAGEASVVYVPQRADAAFSCSTVRDEIGLAPRCAGVSTRELDDMVHAALAAVGLDGSLLARDPRTLSGGERRRVAIAAALVSNPDLLVLDEPSAGLDALARARVRDVIASVQQRGIGTIVITHDAEEARDVADRVILVNAGCITSDAPVDVLLTDVDMLEAHAIEAEPIVIVARALATREKPMPHGVRRSELEAWVVERLASGDGPEAASQHTHVPQQFSATISSPPRAGIDARARIAAWLIIVIGVFIAPTMAGVGLMLSATLLAALWQRHALASIVLALRPVVPLLAGMVLLQAVVGANPEIALIDGTTVASGVLWSTYRSMQVCALIIAGLMLGAGTGALDLARGIAWLAAPLNILRVPVSDLALVLGIGASASSSMALEIAALEQAQRARGIGRRSMPWRMRIRTRTILVIPLIVIAAQRARDMAEVLAMRGFTRGMGLRQVWPAQRAGGIDLLVPAMAACVLAAALQL